MKLKQHGNPLNTSMIISTSYNTLQSTRSLPRYTHSCTNSKAQLHQVLVQQPKGPNTPPYITSSIHTIAVPRHTSPTSTSQDVSAIVLAACISATCTVQTLSQVHAIGRSPRACPPLQWLLIIHSKTHVSARAYHKPFEVASLLVPRTLTPLSPKRVLLLSSRLPKDCTQ